MSELAKEQARFHVETLARSLFQIHGFPSPSSDVLGRIFSNVTAGVDLRELSARPA